MNRPFWTVVRALTLRYYREHPLRFFLCFVGVAAGVAISASIRLTNDRIVRSFSDSVDVLVGQSHLHVEFPAGLPVERLEDFRFLWNTGGFSPCMRLNARHGGQSIRLFGVDLVAGGIGRRFRVTGGDRAQSAMRVLPGESILVIPERSLLVAGEALTLQTGSRSLHYNRLVRLASVNGQTIPPDVAYTDIGGLLAAGHRLTCMDVMADREEHVPGLREAILRVEPSAVIETPDEKKASSRELLAAFQMNLSALGAVALVVSAFLVYNTMSISILQRQRLAALLNVQGATRSQIFAAYLLEGAGFGLYGGIVGIAVGVVMAGWADGEVSQTLRNVFRAEAHAAADLRDATALASSLVGGVLFALLAALHPAWQGSRRVARVLLRGDSGLSAKALKWLSGAGLAALAIFVLLGYLALRQESVSLGFLGVAALILTLSLMAPAAVVGFVIFYRLLPAPPEAKLAAAELRMHVGRLSVAVASLAIALSMAGSITIMVHSFRTTVEAWLKAVMVADIYVSPEAGALFPGETLNRAVVDRIAVDPEVGDVLAVRRLSVAVDGMDVDLFSEDLADLARLAPPSFVEGGLEDVREASRGKGIVVSEVFAQRLRRHRGDRVALFGKDFRIVAVVRNFNSSRGAVWMDPKSVEPVLGRLEPSALGLFLRPGVDAGRALDRLRGLTASQGAHLSLNREIREQAMVIFDRTFHMTRLLQAMAGGIAVLAFVTTLLSLNLEQKRVLVTLMALGVSSRSCALTLLLQSLFMGLVGLLLAFPGSGLLSWLLIYVLNRFSFGWTIVPDVPWVVLVETGLLVLIFGALAAIWPAHLLLRESPADTLRKRE